MNYYKKFSNNRSINLGLIIVALPLFIFGLWSYFYTIITTGVNVDPSYYLSIVERIREGNVLYKDVISGYNPIMYHFMAFIKNLFNLKNNYIYDLTILLIIQFFNCFFLYKISRFLSISKHYSVYLVVLFFISYISFWKFEFILEPIATFFGLASIFFLLKNNLKFYLFSAILCSLAFMVKQYALVFLALNLYLILVNRKKYLIYMFSYFIVFLVPIIIYYFYNENFVNIFSVKYSNYSKEDETFMNVFFDRSQKIYSSSLIFIKFFPILLMSFLVIISKKLIFKKEVIFAFLGICGFMLQFIFAPFYHYYLFLLPFVFYIIFFALQSIKNRVLFYLYLLFMVVNVFFIIQRTYHIVNTEQTFSKKEQTRVVELLNKKYNSKKNIYVLELELNALYYLLNLSPPNNNYTFGIASDNKFIQNQIMLCDSFICLETTKLEEHINFKELSSVFELDSKIDINMLNKPNKILIYKKKNSVKN